MRKILLCTLLFCWPLLASSSAVVDLASTVVKKRLEPGVSIDDAVDSMKLRANLLNMKLVAELPLSKQLESMGVKSRHLTIYQFCDPMSAMKMVEFNTDFAAYLPCRITVTEDANNDVWLVMMNLDAAMRGESIPPEYLKYGKFVWKSLLEIMDAGATGDL